MSKKMIAAIIMVLVMSLVGSVVYASSRWDGHSREQLISEIETRDTLIGQQEALLNTYRCLFGVDTEIVPGGCSGDSSVGATPSVTPVPEPTPRSSWATLIDSYWGGLYYYVVYELNTSNTYCEVHLTNSGRRIGEWDNSFKSGGHYGRFTFDIFNPEGSFDGVVIECN